MLWTLGCTLIHAASLNEESWSNKNSEFVTLEKFQCSGQDMGHFEKRAKRTDMLAMTTIHLASLVTCTVSAVVEVSARWLCHPKLSSIRDRVISKVLQGLFVPSLSVCVSDANLFCEGFPPVLSQMLSDCSRFIRIDFTQLPSLLIRFLFSRYLHCPNRRRCSSVESNRQPFSAVHSPLHQSSVKRSRCQLH